MNIFSSIALLLSSACALVSCSMKHEDAVYVKVGNANFYESDLDLLLASSKAGNDSARQSEVLKTALLELAVIESGKKIFPSVAEITDDYMNRMKSRYLTTVYQNFYVTECLFYPEDVLKREYERQSSKYASDSLNFAEVRSSIAEDLYVRDHKMAFDSLLNEIKSNSNMTEEEANKSAKERLIKTFKEKVYSTTGTSLQEKYKMAIVPAHEQDLKKIYDVNQSMWMTSPGLVAYHIQMSDSSKLAAAIQNVKTLDDFKNVAAKSENKELAKRNGELGFVLKDHSLPYGLGLIPELFNAFAYGNTGMSDIIYKPLSNEYHVFYVTEQIPAKLKSFERVKKFIEIAVSKGEVVDDVMAPIATSNGIPVLFEKDILALVSENSALTQKGYNRNYLVSLLMSWYAFAEEAKAVGLDLNPEFQAYLRRESNKYAYKRIIDSVSTLKMLSIEDAKPYYEKYADIFDNAKLENIVNEISWLYSAPENIAKYQFYFERAEADTSNNFKPIMSKRFSKVKFKFREHLARQFFDRAEKENPLVFMKKDHINVNWNLSVDDRIAYIENLVNQKKFREANSEWVNMRYAYFDVDSVVKKTTFALAKLEADMENFDDAFKQNAVVAGMFPETAEGEKALFNMGFILDENLGKKNEAAAIYRQFIEKYPNSEMAESAKWLLENIESKGQLAKDLIEKIETAE